MTYSDALFFIGKCLTLDHYPVRIEEVRKTILSGLVEWEQVVWVSTGQFVFPALHLQLKRAGLLPELPAELVEYMEEFTGQNRERNRQIINEALEITTLLNQNNISPIFLKGSAHLLEGLYGDIGERMVGDIDFLVDDQEMVLAADLLLRIGYVTTEEYIPKYLKLFKHYPRLRNDNRVAAIEIHRQILNRPAYKAIDGKTLIQKRIKLNLPSSAFVLCNKHQIIHNILHVQIADLGYYYGVFSLRQVYDLYQLSQKENVLKVVSDFGKFFHPMNANLALANKLLGDPPCLPYEHNWQSKLFLGRFQRHINYPGLGRISHAILYLFQRFSNYGIQLVRSIYIKEIRHSLYSRLSNPKWYKAHLRGYRENI